MPKRRSKQSEGLSADIRREFGSKYPETLAKVNVMFTQMQTPESKAGVRAAFNLSPDELGRLAVIAAQEKSD